MSNLSISNPIFKILKKLKLVSKKNLKVKSNFVRDSLEKNKVFFETKNKFFFLQNSIYSKEKKFDKLFKDNLKNKNFSIKFKNKRINTQIINDDNRRYELFKKNLKEKKILDFGAGYGEFIKKFKKKNVYALEKRNICIRHLEKNKITVFKNIKDINQKFDYITFFNSLDHLEHPDLILKKMKKLLKKKGKLIIEVPNANNILFLSNLNEYQEFSFSKKHLIIFTEKVLKKILSYSGFKVRKVIYFQRYDFNNHLNWFINKRPNGHNELKHLSTRIFNKHYKKLLIKLKLADTLIVIAE